MSASMGHDRSKNTNQDHEDEEDLVENMMKRTGCLEKHYIVQVKLIPSKLFRSPGDNKGSVFLRGFLYVRDAQGFFYLALLAGRRIFIGLILITKIKKT